MQNLTATLSKDRRPVAPGADCNARGVTSAAACGAMCNPLIAMALFALRTACSRSTRRTRRRPRSSAIRSLVSRPLLAAPVLWASCLTAWARSTGAWTEGRLTGRLEAPWPLPVSPLRTAAAPFGGVTRPPGAGARLAPVRRFVARRPRSRVPAAPPGTSAHHRRLAARHSLRRWLPSAAAAGGEVSSLAALAWDRVHARRARLASWLGAAPPRAGRSYPSPWSRDSPAACWSGRYLRSPPRPGAPARFALLGLHADEASLAGGDGAHAVLARLLSPVRASRPRPLPASLARVVPRAPCRTL